MVTARFKEVQPVLPARDVAKAFRYYVDRLGFRHAFGVGDYIGVRRDGVELHLQWQSNDDFDAGRAGQAMLRLVVDDPDALFEEYKTKEVFHERTALGNTSWGTREFAFFDPDGNGLTFYRDLRPDEKG
jgi:catechol 2,3-dioxygenase-like lactoylglutathione lyase family enzyme